MSIRLLPLVVLIVLSCTAYAQKQISGKVFDDNNDGIAGAAVLVKGTTDGTVTDAGGAFRFTTNAQAAYLIIQAVGYETQEVTVSGSEIIIRMRVQSQLLNETVITAYGIRRNKNDLPYAAQKINGSELNPTRESNMVNALSGKVAGLDIKRNNTLGGSTNVVVRGIKSLSGNNQALFVVDGVPMDNSNVNNPYQIIGGGGYDYGATASDINADNIESITVLKGAAATALYGSRAANGVILINTKKANRQQGFGITVNTGFTTGSIDKSTWIKYQKKYGGGYGPFYESPDGHFFYRDILGNGTPALVVPTSEDASFGAAFDPGLMVYDWKSLDPRSPYYHHQTPWVAAPNDPTAFFVKPFSSNLAVSISGANDAGGLSVGYTRTMDKGIIENSSIVKNLINISGSYKLSSRLSLSVSTNISNITGKGRYETGENYSPTANFRQWWQTNVDVKQLRDAYFQQKTNATWNYLDPDLLIPIYWNNPYWKIYENYETDNRFRNYGNMTLNYTVTDWLDLMGRVGLDAYSEMREERNAIGSVETPSYSKYLHSFHELNYDLIGNFHKQVSKHISLSGLIGTNIRRSRNESTLARTNGGLVVPDLYALSNTVNAISAPEEVDERIGVNGIFAGATVSYKSMLILDATLRRDASSTLPAASNKYYYPSASLGFVFSELLPKNDILNFGKARVNYAEVGNGAQPHSLTDVKFSQAPFGGQPVYQTGFIKNNENLRPERTKSFEGGLELAFWKNRAGIDFTYYNTRSVDQILQVPVSPATGYYYKFINAGEIQNKGIEITAFVTPVKTKDCSWLLNVNFARNRNKIINLPGIDNITLVNWGGPTLNAAPGLPYGTFKGSDYVYDGKGERVIDNTGHYLKSETSDHIIGNANPDWTGGITNTLRYKTVSLSFLIDIKKGGNVYSMDRYFGLNTGLPKETAGLNELGNPMRNDPADPDHPGGIILKGVKEDGTKNDIRIPVEYGTFGYSYNPDKAFIYDASYVKLRELSLTYSMPERLIRHLRYVKNINVSLIGRNLWIIHKNLPDADPEDGFSSGNIQGFQAGSYPLARTYGFNLKFNF